MEDQNQNISNYPKKDEELTFIVRRMDHLSSNVDDLRSDMKSSIKEMSAAIQQLIRIEERQLTSNRMIEKLSNKLEGMENRIDELEKEGTSTKRVVDWFYKGVFAIVMVVGAYVFKLVGLY